MTDLASLSWPELAERAAGSILAVPVGSTEQHGPHLPLATDTLLAGALAEGLAGCRPDVLVAPALPYGSSGEHAGFPGTLSIGREALELVVLELVRSADAFAGVVLVSGHGGNADPLDRAARTATAEGRSVLVWAPRAASLAGLGDRPPDGHAGWVETSILLDLAPGTVRSSRAEAGNPRPLAELAGELRTGGVAAVSPNGVLGDPAGAGPELGRACLEALLADLAATVAARFGEPR